jgi:hypothetical protein
MNTESMRHVAQVREYLRALHKRALGMTCVHSENGRFVVNKTAARSARWAIHASRERLLCPAGDNNTWGGHLVVGRVDADGADPRFRLTPLGRGRYGLSLHDRNRWDPLPYEGTLNELVEVMNTDLGSWAAAWPDLSS